MNIPERVKAIVKTCKALQGKTIFDIVKMQEFQDNLEAYVNCQNEDREKTMQSLEAIKVYSGKKNLKVPAHVIDHFKGWKAKDYAYEYMRILQQRSGCNADERRYILQISQQAYNKTVADIVIAEFPKLKKYFYENPN